MASTVDNRHLTGSPLVSLPASSAENHPPHSRGNAVASEVQVIATGARPAEKGGQRELFTEETTTALVFENGGVLRLAAAVVPGQLLFLTHKETKREVVAQVTRKRDFRPTICYVEVEFSEPAPGFWGLEFPKAQAAAPATAPVRAPKTAQIEPPQMQEYILADEPAEPTEAPSAEEISALKDEVEVLREQLKLLQTQAVARNLPAPAAIPASPSLISIEPPRAPAVVPYSAGAEASIEPKPKVPAAPAVAPQHSPREVSAGPATLSANPTSSSNSGGNAEPPFDEADLLPRPALNFKDTKQPTNSASDPNQHAVASGRSAAMRKDLLFAAFVLITAGAAWYQNLLPWLSRTKNPAPGAASIAGAHPATAAQQRAAGRQADAGKPTQTGDATTTPANADARDSAQVGAGQTAAGDTPETATTGQLTVNAPTDAAVAPEKRVAGASAGKRSAVPPLSKAAMVTAEGNSDGAAVVPPKLIKSVKAVASPNALQDFGGGGADNVKIDALVDASGHVRSMKALSGPPALQSAAMEALKQYVYEPATKHGKPVPAHVTVSVHPGTSADSAGLHAGDVIHSVNGYLTTDPETWPGSSPRRHPPGRCR